MGAGVYLLQRGGLAKGESMTGRKLADLVAAAEVAGRVALVQIGATMAALQRHSRALEDDMRALQEHPLDQLVRVTGESQEALIAEWQGSVMDYQEFYWFKMNQARARQK